MDKLPQRKIIRLKHYDYSQDGYYFITICTKNRMNILGKINVNTNNVGVDAHIDPYIELTHKGQIVNKYIQNFNKFENINLDEYIVMPNHIHMIISLNGSMWASTPTIFQVIKSFKILCSKEIGYTIWQRNYYEHVIRTEKEYYEIKQYIRNNIATWVFDKYFQ